MSRRSSRVALSKKELIEQANLSSSDDEQEKINEKIGVDNKSDSDFEDVNCKYCHKSTIDCACGSSSDSSCLVGTPNANLSQKRIKKTPAQRPNIKKPCRKLNFNDCDKDSIQNNSFLKNVNSIATRIDLDNNDSNDQTISLDPAIQKRGIIIDTTSDSESEENQIPDLDNTVSIDPAIIKHGNLIKKPVKQTNVSLIVNDEIQVETQNATSNTENNDIECIDILDDVTNVPSLTKSTKKTSLVSKKVLAAFYRFFFRTFHWHFQEYIFGG